MSELREVFDMVTKQTEPDLDSWKEQERRQRRAARSRKAGVIGLVAALIAGAILFAVTNLGSGRDGTLPVPASTGSPDIPSQAPLGLAIVGLDGTVEEDLTLPTDAWIPDMSADGTHIVFLSASKKLGFCGACGADGDRLAATPLRESSGGYIYLDTSDDIGSVENPVWCPQMGTGSRFVGVGTQDGNRDIFVATLQGRDGFINAPTRRLTFDPADDEFPAWSPDGSTIFYDNGGAEPLNDSGFSTTQEIWSVRAYGGTPLRLTDNQVADGQPDVSADGTVAFWREEAIWTMDPQGSNQVQLEAVPTGTGFSPRWSPDGTMLALLRYDPTERASFDPQPGRTSDLPLLEVVVVDLATGDVTVVGPRVASYVNPVSWMPDGSALLINRYDAGA